jgi:hypothetical protein
MLADEVVSNYYGVHLVVFGLQIVAQWHDRARIYSFSFPHEHLESNQGGELKHGEHSLSWGGAKHSTGYFAERILPEGG